MMQFNFGINRPNRTSASSDKDIHIRLSKNGRFVVTAPLRLNRLVKDMPDRTYLRALQAYEAPAIMANVRYIRDHLLTSKRVTITDEARAKLEEVAKNALTSGSRIPFPATYPFKLLPWPYQEQCLNYVWGNPYAFLDMDMGLGKSFLSLTYMSARFLKGEVEALLIMCPVSVRYNWLTEIEKHLPESITPSIAIIGASEDPVEIKRLCKMKDDPTFKIVIVGIESLSAAPRLFDIAHGFCEIFKGRMGGILDEAHLIKNSDATRSKRVYKLGDCMPYKICMTGTPIGSEITDLFSYFYFLNPGILGLSEKTSFFYRYTTQDRDGAIDGYKNERELSELMNPWTFQARKEDCLADLPPQTWTRRHVTLLPAQYKLIEELKNGPSVRDAKNPKELFSALSRLTKAQQVTEGYYGELDPDLTMQTGRKQRKITWVIDPAKSPKFLDTLETIREIGDKPVIVWTKYTASLEALAEMMRGEFGAESVVTYYGKTSMRDREKNRAAFANGKVQLFVANPACAGTGLNGLTVAAHAIYEANSFKYIERHQSEARIHRPGQINPVQYIDILGRKSIDGGILSALTKRKNLVDYIRETIAGGDIWD